MGTRANKEIVRQYVELWKTGNLALADEIIAPDLLLGFTHLSRANALEMVFRFKLFTLIFRM